MFTGIVTDLGRVLAREARGDTRFRIGTAFPVEDIAVGASIACNGCCLTAVETGRTDDGTGWFDVDASAETLGKTTLGDWEAGTPVNLERSLTVGDEIGGHFVLGHVDGVAAVTDRRRDGDSWRFAFRAPEALARYIAPKGSITLDGVSFTVNDVEGAVFGVNIVPHTAAVTRFGAVDAGDRVNLEVDALARYVARLLDREDA